MSNFKTTEVWSPCDDLKDLQTTNNYGVMILNTPIKIVCNPLVIANLWTQGRYVIS